MLLTHDPDNGVFGDCFRACVASIIELPAEQVPHFFHDGQEPPQAPKDEPGRPGWERLNEFLATLPVPLHSLGLALESASAYCAWMDSLRDNFDLHYILGGYTERETSHAVVGHRGRIVHDPHPSRAGLLVDRFPIDLIFLVRR